MYVSVAEVLLATGQAHPRQNSPLLRVTYAALAVAYCFRKPIRKWLCLGHCSLIYILGKLDVLGNKNWLGC